MARKKSGELTLELKDSIGIEQAATIKKQLIDAFAKNEKVYVDVSKITDADASIIQLFVAANKEAQAQNKVFAFSGQIPEEISSLVKKLSLTLPLKEAVNA